MFDVTRQLFDFIQILSFLDDNDLVIGHHGKTLGITHQRGNIGIFSIDDGLVKFLLCIGKDVLLNPIRDLINKIGLFP